LTWIAGLGLTVWIAERLFSKYGQQDSEMPEKEIVADESI